MTDVETIKQLQTKLEEALSLIIKMQNKGNAQASPEADAQEIPAWAKARLELWARVYLEGNGSPIDKKRVEDLWVKMGNNKIGTAGFFGGKRASFQMTIDNKVTLTPWADKQTKEWTGVLIKDYAKQFKPNKGDQK